MDGTGTGGDFSANLELSTRQPIGGQIETSTSSNTTITGFNTNFNLDLKIGDIIEINAPRNK